MNQPIEEKWKEDFNKLITHCDRCPPYLGTGVDGDTDMTEEVISFIKNLLEQERKKYQELIYAVGNKYPGETRHQTALRYITNAEKRDELAKSIINK